MLFEKYTKITIGVNKLKCNDLYVLAVGYPPEKTPSLGDYYTFISRLWLYDIKTYRKNPKILRSYKKKPTKIKATGKNQKLSNKYCNVVKKITNLFKKGRSFSKKHEKLF